VTLFQKSRALCATVLLAMAAFPLHAEAPGANVELTVAGAGPRQLEPTLLQSIRRDYGKAWQTMSVALQSGEPAILDQYWVGVAHDKLQRLIRDEGNTGVQVRYIDKSHQLQAVFYPNDGAALLLHDSARIEVQVLSAGKVIDSENLTEHYVVLMTPGQDRWLVRVFQSVPSF
jgi:hypothetical protein